MTIYDRETAARRAEASTSNRPGTCQLWTRTQFGAPSAGDRDGDGDADAMDGWQSEPTRARHVGDRNPPRGVPVAFSGGSKGYGHRAVSLGNGKIRSTDMTATGYKPGVVGTTSIAQIERSMGVRYLGWSETITGQPIPLPEPAKPKPKPVKPLPPAKRVKLLRAAARRAAKAGRTKRAARIRKWADRIEARAKKKARK